MTTFTKTETTRRIRQLSRQMRETYGLAPNWAMEIQVRKLPFTSTTAPHDNYRHNGDDVEDMLPLKYAVTRPEFQVEGLVVHIAFRSGGYWGELQDVVCGWLGTSTQPPQVLGR